MISIVVCAWKIPTEHMLRFVSWNKDIFAGIVGEIIFVCDRPEKIDGASVLVYPVDQPIFSIPRTINYGIRRSTGDIVIKTDMDIAFSREVLLQVVDGVSESNGLICICANIKWFKNVNSMTKSWAKVTKRRKGRGACFAMTHKDWFALNGYNEKIQGWGGDDEEMWRRASKKLTIIESWSNPLFHISHPLRKNKPGFPILSSKNIRIGKSGWASESWGDPTGELI